MLRATPIYRALYRPNLLFGADRVLVIASGGAAGYVILSGMNPIALVIGAGLWFIALWFLRRIAKADHLMRDVYIRSLRYAGYYPAKSRPYRQDPRSAMTKGRM